MNDRTSNARLWPQLHRTRAGGIRRFSRALARLALLATAWLCAVPDAVAVEGSTAAGPLGGTDIRSAQLPPPGLYGGISGLLLSARELRDGSGQKAPGLDAVNLLVTLTAPFLAYVPDVKVLGGSVGVLGVLPAGRICGQFVSSTPRRCATGFGDPYVELAWSRSFGHLRPSRTPGALPIFEGLSLGFGLGVVVPIGQYNPRAQATNGATIGNNTWDIAPSVALTYTSQPWFAEGTEVSAKLYWNNYGTNPKTQYRAGSLINIDFAVTERIGRFQAGIAGFYARQIASDRQFGRVVGPDGRRVEYLNIGPVLNYDIPEWNAAIRIKALTTLVSKNTVVSNAVLVSFARKL